MQCVQTSSSPLASESEQATQQFGKKREMKSENNSLKIELAILEIYLPATVFLNVLIQNYFMGLVEDFNTYRSKMNDKIMASDSLIIKRIFNLDTNAYAEGHLDVKSKELIGLTCSLVLRCDDCVRYHLGKCKEVGFTTEEVHEAMGVATLVGGTIVIPHLRRAFEYWEELQNV
jgi:AhpD family alkylhydroperoxidase